MAMKAKGTVTMREIMRSFVSSNSTKWRTTLWENTVPSARMAPSEVDMDAATMPRRPQAPRNAGGSVVSSLMKALGSGFHAAHVGRSRIVEQVSASKSAYLESGP